MSMLAASFPTLVTHCDRNSCSHHCSSPTQRSSLRCSMDPITCILLDWWTLVLFVLAPCSKWQPSVGGKSRISAAHWLVGMTYQPHQRNACSTPMRLLLSMQPMCWNGFSVQYRNIDLLTPSPVPWPQRKLEKHSQTSPPLVMPMHGFLNTSANCLGLSKAILNLDPCTTHLKDKLPGHRMASSHWCSQGPRYRIHSSFLWFPGHLVSNLTKGLIISICSHLIKFALVKMCSHNIRLSMPHDRGILLWQHQLQVLCPSHTQLSLRWSLEEGRYFARYSQSQGVANEELQEGVKGRDAVEALALPCSWFSYLYLTGPMQLVARPHYAPEGESDFTEKQPREAFGQRISMQKRFFKKK